MYTIYDQHSSLTDRDSEVSVHLPLHGGHLPVHVAAEGGPGVQHGAGAQGGGVAGAAAQGGGLVAGRVAVSGGVARHPETNANCVFIVIHLHSINVDCNSRSSRPLFRRKVGVKVAFFYSIS